MKYDIIRSPGSLIDLRTLVEHSMQRNGWTPLGAPFYDQNERQWCQAMTGPPAGAAGLDITTHGTRLTGPEDVRLREPKRK